VKLEKLDARHKGFNKFKYRIWFDEPKDEKFIKFNTVRTDCWTIWGPSCELDFTYRDDAFKTPNWAFYTDGFNRTTACYIYLRSDEEASFIKLKYM
jgi:hypothetical protein